jgi:hypothetical protein
VTDEPGLFELPDPVRPARPARTARGRARERFARRVVVDVAVVDVAVLRAEALRILDQGITISEGALDDDDDLLSPEEEITASVAAAVQWCVEPTEGLWPLLEAGAVRIDAIELRAEELGPSQVRVSWTVTVKISDAEAVRELARVACPDTEQDARAEIDAGFAAAWHWAADPCTPVTDIPGVTWTCVEVAVEQVLARTR